MPGHRFRLFVLAAALLGVAGLAVLPSRAQQPPSPYPSYPPPPPYPVPSPYPPPQKFPPPHDQATPFPFPIPYPDAQTQQLLLEGAERVMRAIDRLIKTAPTYDPPVIAPNGDIVIRRRPAPELPPEPKTVPRAPIVPPVPPSLPPDMERTKV